MSLRQTIPLMFQMNESKVSNTFWGAAREIKESLSPEINAVTNSLTNSLIDKTITDMNYTAHQLIEKSKSNSYKFGNTSLTSIINMGPISLTIQREVIIPK